MPTPSEFVLLEARKLIQTPTAWTTGCIARDAAGRPCSATAPEATRFSLMGALHSASRHRLSAFASEAACLLLGDMLAKRLGQKLPAVNGSKLAVDLVAVFNDIATHDAVLSLIDSALRKRA